MVIQPVKSKDKKKSKKKVQEHPFFGMLTKEPENVDELMNQLRRDRHHAL